MRRKYSLKSELGHGFGCNRCTRCIAAFTNYVMILIIIFTQRNFRNDFNVAAEMTNVRHISKQVTFRPVFFFWGFLFRSFLFCVIGADGIIRQFVLNIFLFRCVNTEQVYAKAF